ncbi:MAG: sugar phosphorylase [Spirochaetales bacterium]|nr:sugar phosphorylase [Spirochaetales bacterium]
MKDLLIRLYGETKARQVLFKIESLIDIFREEYAFPGNQSGCSCSREFTQKDAVLITYPDLLSDGHRPPLEVLLDFLDTCIQDTINTVHILPFFPYSSDDGFSVIDYYEVDNALGGWEGITAISKKYRLMCDAVLNHVSSRSRWFQGFLAGEPEYSEYFITCNPNSDLSGVTRPRPYPLLTPFDTHRGKKWVWTTFSNDQIDLNFRNPAVLIEMIKVLLTYVIKGAGIIRLDAIAYIWKEPGTNCIHRPEVHAIVKLFRKILDKIRPDVVLITETNVPHEENISYFGTGEDEAQMVYQFSLPPLIIHALVNETAFYLCRWASDLTLPAGSATFFNFTASHDGIGVRPLSGLVPEGDIDTLTQLTKQRGGDVSYKKNRDGSRSPYELNINYFSMVTVPYEEETLSVKRFLLSQSIMLVMPGVPGIYFHSLVGSVNYKEGPERTGILRSINREKLDYSRLEKELKTIQRRKSVFSFYMNMLAVRRKEPAFNPLAPFKVLKTHKTVFAIERILGEGSSIIAVHNMSSHNIRTIVAPASKTGKRLTCILTGITVKAGMKGKFPVDLPPHHFLWLKEG